MRTTAVTLGLPALLLAVAVPLSAQGFFTDARRIGMGGVSLSIDGTLTRYNPAYRSVPKGRRSDLAWEPMCYR